MVSFFGIEPLNYNPHRGSRTGSRMKRFLHNNETTCALCLRAFNNNPSLAKGLAIRSSSIFGLSKVVLTVSDRVHDERNPSPERFFANRAELELIFIQCFLLLPTPEFASSLVNLLAYQLNRKILLMQT